MITFKEWIVAKNKFSRYEDLPSSGFQGHNPSATEDMPKCSTCDTELNPDDEDFAITGKCPHCGEKVDSEDPVDYSPPPPRRKRCKRCGQRIIHGKCAC